jgi:hypothetical protein
MEFKIRSVIMYGDLEAESSSVEKLKGVGASYS